MKFSKARVGVNQSSSIRPSHKLEIKETQGLLGNTEKSLADFKTLNIFFFAKYVKSGSFGFLPRNLISINLKIIHFEVLLRVLPSILYIIEIFLFLEIGRT